MGFKNRIMAIVRSCKEKAENKKVMRNDQELTSLANKSVNILWKGLSAKKKKLCYFSSFDKDGCVADYVFYYLKKLVEIDFEVVFISTSPMIMESNLNRLKECTIAVILRPNLGLDFFSWKLGMQLVSIDIQTEEVIYANDSVYGPCCDFKLFYDRLRDSEYDLVGFTDNWDIAYHIQSYFLYCKCNLIRSNILQDFFSNVSVISDKMNLIKEYEIGISQRVLKAGFKVGALADYRVLYKNFFDMNRISSLEYQYRYNSTIVFWLEILENSYSPFIKRSLFSILNHDVILFSSILENIITRSDNDFQYSFLMDHLKRYMKIN